jgi:hypothetical protein
MVGGGGPTADRKAAHAHHPSRTDRGSVTFLLHCCYTVVTLLLHCCYSLSLLCLFSLLLPPYSSLVSLVVIPLLLLGDVWRRHAAGRTGYDGQMAPGPCARPPTQNGLSTGLHINTDIKSSTYTYIHAHTQTRTHTHTHSISLNRHGAGALRGLGCTLRRVDQRGLLSVGLAPLT